MPQARPTSIGSSLETVVFVHGTWASAEDDRGEAWWQWGSQWHRDLSRHLPADVSLPAAHEVFHWSGENTEFARDRAAVDLLHRLAVLEANGTGYHLVGHSHGGSIIWKALRWSVRDVRLDEREYWHALSAWPKAQRDAWDALPDQGVNEDSLQGLRSWTTVGTPFMHRQFSAPDFPGQ